VVVGVVVVVVLFRLLGVTEVATKGSPHVKNLAHLTAPMDQRTEKPSLR
jgi:hypothetical protein